MMADSNCLKKTREKSGTFSEILALKAAVVLHLFAHIKRWQIWFVESDERGLKGKIQILPTVFPGQSLYEVGVNVG